MKKSRLLGKVCAFLFTFGLSNIVHAVYIDVEAWEGGDYNGAWGVIDHWVGQTFVANSTGSLQGVTLNGASSEQDTEATFAVYSYDLVADQIIGLVDETTMIVPYAASATLDPVEFYVPFNGTRNLFLGAGYIISVHLASPDQGVFYLQSNVDNYPYGGIRYSEDEGLNWASYIGQEANETDFRVWLDTAVAVVPIPPALYLFGSGLLGLVGMARRMKAA